MSNGNEDLHNIVAEALRQLRGDLVETIQEQLEAKMKDLERSRKAQDESNRLRSIADEDTPTDQNAPKMIADVDEENVSVGRDAAGRAGIVNGSLNFSNNSNEKSKFSYTLDDSVLRGNESEEVGVNYNDANRVFVDVKISGTTHKMLMDTGSDITLMGTESWRRMGSPALEPSGLTMKCANNSILKTYGKVKVKFVIKGQSGSGYAYIKDGRDLLGLEWLRQIPEVEKLLTFASVNSNSAMSGTVVALADELKSMFSSVFKEGLGTYNKGAMAIRVKKDAKPIFCKARPVPYGMLDVVNGELDRLLEMKVIQPVNHSEWAAAIVVVKKKNGKPRVCIDFKRGINSCIEDETHPIPLIEDIFASLKGSVYSQIDLADAYLQLPVDAESKKLLVINTHRGLFRYNRLPFGVKVAPMLFQRVMDKLIAGLPGVVSYLDDVIVCGDTVEEHDDNLKKLFERLAESGLQVRMEKCTFRKPEIKFLGFIVDSGGRRTDPSRTEVIKNMKAPDDQKKLRSFLGMVSFYSRFIPRMSDKRGPLDKLLVKDTRWEWTPEHEEAFRALRDIVASDMNLIHFQPELPIVVTCDASEYGIGGVIAHIMEDGREIPIAHAARSLTKCEQKYSQMEKEALGIVFTCTKFHKYLYGRRFLLKSDHKPLLKIYGSNQELPVHSQSRLVRWATILMAYQFDMEYLKSEEMGEADALSRLKQNIPTEDDDVLIAELSYDDVADVMRKLPVREEDVRRESRNDSLVSKLIEYVTKKWPNERHMDESIKRFYRKKEDMVYTNGCLLVEGRVLVPRKLRYAVLQQLHDHHPGIMKMKQIARSFVCWPGIDKDCEDIVRQCRSCQENQKTAAKAPLAPWPEATRVWERVHIDYAGPDEGNWYLVVVDSKSKWPEVAMMNTTNSAATIKALRTIFARHGYPEKLVSDNGTQFTSVAFSEMCQEFGIEHIRTPAFHPQSNGLAERFVDTLKRGLRRIKGEGKATEAMLQKLLMAYRTTPHAALDGKSPAEVCIGRKLRNKMSLLMPQAGEMRKMPSTVTTNMKMQFDSKHGVKERQFRNGDTVSVKVYSQNSWSWKPGKVMRKLGKVCYIVEVLGKTKKFHVNQMRHDETARNREEAWLRVMEGVFDLNCIPKSVLNKEEAQTGEHSDGEPIVRFRGENQQPEEKVQTPYSPQELRMSAQRRVSTSNTPTPTPRSESNYDNIATRTNVPKAVKWWIKLNSTPTRTLRRSTRTTRAPERYCPGDYEKKYYEEKKPTVRFARIVSCENKNYKMEPSRLGRHVGFKDGKMEWEIKRQNDKRGKMLEWNLDNSVYSRGTLRSWEEMRTRSNRRYFHP